MNAANMPTHIEMKPQHRSAASRWTRLAWMSALAVTALTVPLMASAQTAGVFPPTVSSITFSPATIASGGSSQLTITLSNANTTAATLTQTLTDTLPVGLTIVGGAGGSCTTGAITASTNTIGYAIGASIPRGSCAITVNVKTTNPSPETFYTDTIPAGALQTDDGANAAATSATLTVKPAVAVPNLVGLSQQQASTALQAAGLVVGTITRAPGPNNIPFNSVFSQNPATGVLVASGGAVALSLSTGPGRATNLASPLTSVPGFVDPSQLSIAAAFERVCAQLQVPGATLNASQRGLLANCNAILGTYGGGNNAAGLKSALDAISGKTATAQQTAGVISSSTQFANIGSRLAQVRAGVGAESFAGLDMGVPALGALGPLTAMLEDITGLSLGGGGASADSARASGPLGIFVNGSLGRGTQSTTDLETGFHLRSTSITAGVDYRYADWFVMGFAGGYSRGSTDFDNGSGKLDSRNISGSIYASMYQRDSLYIDLIGTFGHIQYDAARTSTFAIDTDSTSTPANCVAGQCTLDTTGSTEARQLAFGVNVGYTFYAGALAFGPDASVNYTSIRVNGFTERDPSFSGLALAYDPQSGNSLLAKAGGNLSYAVSTRFAVILPQVRAHYVHEFENNQRTLSAHFIDDPTVSSPTGPISNFVVFTDQPDRTYFDWAAGISAQFSFGISAFVDYSAVGGKSDLRTSELAVGLRLRYPL